ncbi:MAG: VIT and VWA domain-containing protein, partial [Elusimicrobiota bacterium]
MNRKNVVKRVAAVGQALALLASGLPAFGQPAAGPGPAPFRFDRPGPIDAPKPEAPVSLTASDGTGLRLASMKSRAVVEGPLAFTELTLGFENPENRVIEGQFRVVMPQGASVSRFAMKNDAGWQEGEVVERAKARVAYEDFLHRRQDPALLEMAGGNEFSARVFPIPAKGVKELIISYSQELGQAESPYILPLKGLPEVGTLDISVSAGGVVLAELKKTSYVPSKDFEAVLPASGPGIGLRSGDLAVVRVRPVLKSLPEPVGSLLVLFDTSASRALGFDSQRRLLAALIEGLAKGSGPETPVTVACFDQAVRPVFEGAAGGFGDEAMASIRKNRALGASNLMAALEWAAGQLKKRPARRILLISDGVATYGETGSEELREAVKKLKAFGAERLDAVAVGGIRDEDLLKRLVTAGLPKDGAVA